jgi:hypothetical protein
MAYAQTEEKNPERRAHFGLQYEASRRGKISKSSERRKPYKTLIYKVKSFFTVWAQGSRLWAEKSTDELMS